MRFTTYPLSLSLNEARLKTAMSRVRLVTVQDRQRRRRCFDITGASAVQLQVVNSMSFAAIVVFEGSSQLHEAVVSLHEVFVVVAIHRAVGLSNNFVVAIATGVCSKVSPFAAIRVIIVVVFAGSHFNLGVIVALHCVVGIFVPLPQAPA